MNKFVIINHDKNCCEQNCCLNQDWFFSELCEADASVSDPTATPVKVLWQSSGCFEPNCDIIFCFQITGATAVRHAQQHAGTSPGVLVARCANLLMRFLALIFVSDVPPHHYLLERRFCGSASVSFLISADETLF